MLTTSLLAFQGNTSTDSNVKGRGSNMTRVDDALDDYWQGIRVADAYQEITLLRNVVDACMTWLKKKLTKSDYRRNAFGQQTNYLNALLMKRKTAVTALGNEALDELYVQLHANGALTPDEAGRHKFDKRKLANRGKAAVARTPVKAMGQDYQFERQTYLASGKTQAISGSGVHAAHRQIAEAITKNLPDHVSYFMPGQAKGRSGFLATRGKALAKKDVHRLGIEDFKILDEIGRLNSLSGDVNYLKKRERYALMASVDATGALRDFQDNLITTSPNDVTAYAMDRYGNLLHKNSVPLRGAFFFNHSSFNAGNDVISAGTLTVTAGILQHIDNNSGHYKPTRDNLHNCLTTLAQDGIDLTQAHVNLYVFINGKKWEHRYHALTFLNHPSSPPDIHAVADN